MPSAVGLGDMANVSWSVPGTSGNWDSTTNWTGLSGGESYPGQFAATGDSVTIGGSNNAYIATFNVLSASIGSITIEGGFTARNSTTLRMTAGSTLNIQGGVTLFRRGESAGIDGAGTISLGGGEIIATDGVGPVAGTVTAGTDTTGGVLDLTGTGSIASEIVFAIGTAAPSTLEFDLAGGTVTTGAITIDNANQTLEIGPSAALDISGGENVANGAVLMAGGTLTDTKSISFGNGSASGSLSGFGTVTGDLTMSGKSLANTIEAIDGNLTLTTAIGKNSGLVFAVGSTSTSALQLSTAPGNGNAFTFLGPAGELDLTASAASGFNDSIVGLNVASAITPTNSVHILGDATVTVASGQSGSGTSGTVTLTDGAVLNLSGITSSPGSWFVNTAPDNGGTGTEVFLSTVCYAAGTHILTATGERAVESLSCGDIVLTLSDGQLSARPVRWVGHRRIDLTRHPRPEAVAPVRVQRGAFADNMPHTDLLLSPDHAIFVDGKLICARQLINGPTIRQEKGWTSVDYFHVELDAHAILLAEGLPTESYLDTGNRGFFSNSGEPLALHPDLTDEADYRRREAGSCAPFVSDEANVRPVWQRLADRTAAIGRPMPQRVTTTDTDLRLLANRHNVKPVLSDSDRVIFVLPGGAGEVRLASRAQSPTEARPWLEDRRRLGVRVKRIVLRGADELREIPVDHPGLTQGWWAVERDGQSMSRWTDGEAVLPLPATHGIVMLEIHLAGAMTYVWDAASEGVTERRIA